MDAPATVARRRPTRRTIREAAAVATVGASALLATGGLLATPSVPPSLHAAGRLCLAFALLLMLAAVGISATMGTLRALRTERTGGRQYDFLRGERLLRVTSMLMELLALASGIILVVLVVAASGIGHVSINTAVVGDAVLVLAWALCVACAAALGQSMRTPTDPQRTRAQTALGWIALAVAALLAALGMTAALGGLTLPLTQSVVRPSDSGPLVVAGFMAAGLGIVRLRRLPTLTAMLWRDPERAEGQALGGSRATAVLIPAITAFALLLVVFFLFLLFGLGIGDLVRKVGSSPLLVGVLLFLVLALAGSLALAFTLARSARGAPALYMVLPDAEVRRRQAIVGGSIVVASLFFAMAVLSFASIIPKAWWIHMLCLGLLTALGPYGFYAAREHNRIRRLEERFPDFLRDVASSHKGGLTLHQAATIAARGEYGALTPDVRKMADQLSWNVSFNEALARFSDRVQTPLVQRAVSLIQQADRSGGSTTDVLLAAARDAREIKNLENERRITMGLYTVVVYITFFVFLGVAAVLYAQFAPQIVHSSQAVQGLGANGAPVEGLGNASLQLAQYQMFYFLAAVVQGIGDGIVAGLLGTGKAVLGLRHAFVMVLLSYILFAFLL